MGSVARQVQQHAARVAACLRDCAQSASEARVGNILGVIAELLDESSTLSIQNAVEAASSDEHSPLLHARKALACNPVRMYSYRVSVPQATMLCPTRPATLYYGGDAAQRLRI